MVVLQKLSRPHFDKNSYFYTVFFRLGFEKKWTTISFRWFKYNKTHELSGIIECSGWIPGWSTGLLDFSSTHALPSSNPRKIYFLAIFRI